MRTTTNNHLSSPALDALVYVSTVELPKLELNTPNDIDNDTNRVKAYAKLEFPQHDFFIRKLSIIIGRRPPQSIRPTKQTVSPPPSPSSSSTSSTESTSSSHHPPTHQDQIDVDLGPIRAVSRKHAALFYDWNFGRWCIQVLGRNGCVIDGRWKAKSEIIPLRSRTKIQIAERIFHFMLPSSAEDLSSSSLVPSHPSLKPNLEPNQSPINRDLTHSTCSSAQVDLSSHPKINPSVTTHSNPLSDQPNDSLANSNVHLGDQDDWNGCESDCEASLSPCQSSPPPRPSQSRQSEQSQSESEESDDDDDDDDGIEDEDPVDHFVDDLAKSDDEPRPPSPPRHKDFNYDMIDFNLIKSDSDSDSADDLNSSCELLPSLPGKAPASKAPKKTAATKAPTGRGKSAGKRPEAHSSGMSTAEPPRPLAKGSPNKQRVGSGGKGNEKSKQTSIKADVGLLVKERRKIECITPPGAEIGTATQKPPYTYASLITQALASQADQDGKMLVSEMCEWMAGVYPFYGAKEKDWQSAVRHNLNADKRFKRIERTPTDGGKGNFWTLRQEEWVHFDGLELRRPKEIKAVPKNDAKVLPSTKELPHQRVAGAPSRSIGNVARYDLAAHHRAITTPLAPLPPSKSPVRPTHHDAIKTTPHPQNDLPVLADAINTKSNLVSLSESYANNSFGIDDNFNFPAPEESEPDPLPQPSPSTSKVLPVPLPILPAIDPNLLGSSSSSVTRPNPSPQQRPTPVLASPVGMMEKAVPKKGTKFEILIQEPNRSSSSKLSNTNPKTQEELKKLIEIEPPMYTNGKNQLILNKTIFNQLKPNQIESLQKLGPNSAIKILQKFILEYFKEKLAPKSEFKKKILDHPPVKPPPDDPSIQILKRKLEHSSSNPHLSSSFSSSSPSSSSINNNHNSKKFKT